MKYIFIFIIKIYQYLFSFDHGLPGKLAPRYRICMFYPSCSEYSRQAIWKYGVLKGSWMSIKRIIKCGPWSYKKRKWDPV